MSLDEPYSVPIASTIWILTTTWVFHSILCKAQFTLLCRIWRKTFRGKFLRHRYWKHYPSPILQDCIINFCKHYEMAGSCILESRYATAERYFGRILNLLFPTVKCVRWIYWKYWNYNTVKIPLSNRNKQINFLEMHSLEELLNSDYWNKLGWLRIE